MITKQEDAPPPELTLGSVYRIRSIAGRDEQLVSQGVFRGMVSAGSVDGLALELDATHGKDKGLIRILPVHMVVTLDILKAEKREVEPAEERDVHYR